MNLNLPSDTISLPTKTLSPVSPKPLRFPNPSSIGVLENQMDPVMNDTSTYMPTPNMSNFITEDQNQAGEFGTKMKAEDGGYANDGKGRGSADVQTSAGSDTDYGMSVDSNNSVALDNHTTSAISSHIQHNERVDHAPDHTSDVAYEPTEQGSVPSPESDLYDDDSSAAPVATSSSTNVPLNPHKNNPEQFFDPTNTSTTSNDEVGTPNYHPVPDNYAATQDVGGGINFQALLENLSASVPTSAHPGHENPPDTTSPGRGGSHDMTLSNAAQNAAKSPALLPMGAANLPPRPPPLETTINSPLETDIRSYHLHDQTSAFGAKSASHLGTNLRPPGNVPPPMTTAGAPGTALGANGLPPPPVATFQQGPPPTSQHLQNTPSTPSSYRQREDRFDNTEVKLNDDEEVQWGPEVQRQYDEFLTVERNYVTQGEWEKFPPNSRLFIGNLPSEKVTKRDIYYVFYKYGKLAQISIKQAYGFVQFLDSQACAEALDAEQGVAIRGRKVHLEISKPQRNTKDKNNADGRGTRNRRSRSPDYSRGGTSSGNQNRADRYRGGGNNGNNRQRDGGRNRDDYRPGRSPSPRSRGRDAHRARERSPERYNARHWSRSRSPQGRMRSPSPKKGIVDDCPLPRRNPRDVPDIQIIAKDNPDRTFIGYVEKAFEAGGVRCDVLILSARLDEDAVVRRQIIEGVEAVMKVDRVVQMTQVFNLSVFNRSDPDNFEFEEYTGLQLDICVKLVQRAKAQARAATTQSTQYGIPIVQAPVLPPSKSYQQLSAQSPQNRQPSAIPPPFPPIDPASLQHLLGRVQQQTPSTPTNQNPFAQPPIPPPHYFTGQQSGQQQIPSASDLSRLLASATASQQQHTPGAYQQQTGDTTRQPHTIGNPNQYTGLTSNPAWANFLTNTPGPAATGLAQQQYQQGSQQYGQGVQRAATGQNQNQGGGQGVPDMSSIMAQLAKYGQ